MLIELFTTNTSLPKPTGSQASSVHSGSHNRNGEQLGTGVCPQLNLKSCKLYSARCYSHGRDQEEGGDSLSWGSMGKVYSRWREQDKNRTKPSYARALVQIQVRGWIQTANQQGILRGGVRGLHQHHGTNQDRGGGGKVTWANRASWIRGFLNGCFNQGLAQGWVAGNIQEKGQSYFDRPGRDLNKGRGIAWKRALKEGTT